MSTRNGIVGVAIMGLAAMPLLLPLLQSSSKVSELEPSEAVQAEGQGARAKVIAADPLPPKVEDIHVRLPMGVSLLLVPVPGEKDLYASSTPVTNAQFQAAVGDMAVRAPTFPAALHKELWERVIWKDGRYQDGQGSSAVLFVCVDEAVLYCRWLERKCPAMFFRLPSLFDPIERQQQIARAPDFNDSYGPRPASGSGAIPFKDRFWHASLTFELLDHRPHLHLVPEQYRDRFSEDLGRRYGESDFRPYFLPSSFRVVAVPNKNKQ